MSSGFRAVAKQPLLKDHPTLCGHAANHYSITSSARAQQPAKVPRVGFLRFGLASANAGRVEALRAGLRELGYVEGKTIVIEFAWAETVDQLHERAAELVPSTIVARPGTSSSISLGASCPSDCANGRTSSDQWDSVLLA
jgi:putative ABC transport system substrate-binding protein